MYDMLPGVCLLLMSPSHTAHSEPALLSCPIAQRFVLLFVLRDKDKHENDTLFVVEKVLEKWREKFFILLIFVLHSNAVLVWMVWYAVPVRRYAPFLYLILICTA